MEWKPIWVGEICVCSTASFVGSSNLLMHSHLRLELVEARVLTDTEHGAFCTYTY